MVGTNSISTHKRKCRPYPEAREYVHSLGLRSEYQYHELCKSGKLPKDIPANPARQYKGKGWVDMFDWLGYKNPEWNAKKIKELLRALIEGRYIYDWDEAVLYSILNTKGVLNLQNPNRHSQFMKNIISAARTTEGRKTIEEYAYSDSEDPPSLSHMYDYNEDEEIQTATSEELARLVENEVNDDQIATAKQILDQTDHLESISVDEESMRFLVLYSILRLWKSAFRDTKNKTDTTIEEVRRQGMNGNRYHDEVVQMFLSDYSGATDILSNLPKGYAFPYGMPTLMQQYVAHKIRTLPFFGNFSGVGTGKTLSAILASRVIESKMTLIVCPNDVVEQWKKRIIEAFYDSKVLTERDEAFNAKYDNSRYQYLVLNYDKFSQNDSPNLILTLVKERIDFVVLDEIHYIKKRFDDNNGVESKRRRNLSGLMSAARKKNDRIKVLGLSATPVVNNLTEGRSLLELMSGKIYDDVATKSTIPNAVNLFVKLTINSIREKEKYADFKTEFKQVEATKPQNITIKQLKSNPLLIEQLLTEARIPEIVRNIKGQTIIYTEYVTKIIQRLSAAIKYAGYSFGLYTGDSRDGLFQFLKNKVQVLIASKPISVGLDGLQEVCNRLIINTLPWTHAQYEQLLGRLGRMGQRNVVEVYIIKASIGGYHRN